MPQRRRCPVCHNYVDHYTDARLTQRIEGHTDKAGNDCPASHYEFTITLASTFTEAELAAQADIARRHANGEQPRRTARRRKGLP